MTKSPAIRTRVAPKSYRIAPYRDSVTTLLDYIIAKQQGGKLVLRIEDTDQKRLDSSPDEHWGNAWLDLYSSRRKSFKGGLDHTDSQNVYPLQKYAE